MPRKKSGDMFEVIIALSVFVYAENGQAAANKVGEELATRLDGLQIDVGHSMVAPANFQHYDA